MVFNIENETNLTILFREQLTFQYYGEGNVKFENFYLYFLLVKILTNLVLHFTACKCFGGIK